MDLLFSIYEKEKQYPEFVQSLGISSFALRNKSLDEIQYQHQRLTYFLDFENWTNVLSNDAVDANECKNFLKAFHNVASKHYHGKFICESDVLVNNLFTICSKTTTWKNVLTSILSKIGFRVHDTCQTKNVVNLCLSIFEKVPYLSFFGGENSFVTRYCFEFYQHLLTEVQFEYENAFVIKHLVFNAITLTCRNLNDSRQSYELDPPNCFIRNGYSHIVFVEKNS